MINLKDKSNFAFDSVLLNLTMDDIIIGVIVRV